MTANSVGMGGDCDGDCATPTAPQVVDVDDDHDDDDPFPDLLLTGPLQQREFLDAVQEELV